MNTDYQSCYSDLELPRHADFSLARTQHKKLTQKWHPDRHTGSDTEFASEQFQRIRKSFQAIKAYHSEHHRLPFQPVPVDDVEFASAHEQVVRQDRAISRQRRRKKTQKTPVSKLSYLLGFLIFAFLIYSSTARKSDYVGGDIFDPPSDSGMSGSATESGSGSSGPLFGRGRSTAVGETLDRQLFGQ